MEESETLIQKRSLYLLTAKQFQSNSLDILVNFAYQVIDNIYVKKNSKIQTMNRIRALSILLQMLTNDNMEEKSIKLSELR
jgi:hypothetical protein